MRILEPYLCFHSSKLNLVAAAVSNSLGFHRINAMLSKTENMDIGVNPWLGKIEGWDVTKCNKTDQAITRKGRRIDLHGRFNLGTEY